MKTFVNKLTGERFPEHGCGHWFRVQEKSSLRNGQQVTKTKFEIFERGKGWRRDKLANWTREEIPDFTGPLPDPNDPNLDATAWKEYAGKYGVFCAREFLSCCDYSKPSWAFQLFTPPQDRSSAVARAWFERVFGLDPLALAVPLLMVCLNRYCFDILAFERLLSKRFAYPKDQDGVSLKSFITDKWGAEVCAYFEKQFLT